MSVTLVGGNGNGLLDSSWTLLNRNETTGNAETGAGEQLYVNVSNGGLVVQHRDAYLPSLGADFDLVRTYNSRGAGTGTLGNLDSRWELSTGISLSIRPGFPRPTFQVTYGDGTTFDYSWDSSRSRYVSTDGSGAFETIEDLGFALPGQSRYLLTRADQSRFYFDPTGTLLRSEDTNGVRMDYIYSFGRLVQVRDDTGHRINFHYNLAGQLYRVSDESGVTLVEYRYTGGRLDEVIDRMGHVTRYFYTSDGLLDRIVLPASQDADGDGDREWYATREIRLDYGTVSFPGGPDGNPRVVRSVTDAEGGVTTFSYDFDFNLGGFTGGTTRVVDALGNNRAYSNDSIYRQWRLANAFYEFYNPLLAAIQPSYQSQVNAILTAHSLSYDYQSNGYITELRDQQGYRTTYDYDNRGNLTSVTDKNGWAVTTSDSAYYRQLRAQLGYVDSSGNGKLVSQLTNAEKNALREAFTSHFRYDSRGNLLEAEDNNGSITSFTYTSFNKVATATSAMGHALTTSNAAEYQEKRVQLGFAALVANLSAADIAALKALYTTTFTYDAKQNLIEQRDPGGDVTRYEYDGQGNRTKRIVFLDATRQQVTQYFYDGFGNNVETVDAEGNHTFAQYDHFGNVTRTVDGKGGITTYTYDKDNRLLTITDAEGHTTLNAYDAVGNRISITDAKGETVYRFFDRNNQLITVLDPKSGSSAQDRLTRFAYDVVGNQTSATDAEGRTTTYTYNARRELVITTTPEVTSATGGVIKYQSSFTYDGEGNRITETDNRGFVTAFSFNEDGLLAQRTDPNGLVTRYTYDANNNQIIVIAGLQLPVSQRRTWKLVFDEEDQLVSEVDAEGHTISYTLDAVGNVVGLQDQNGNRTDYEFDRNNRMVREIRPAVIDPVTGLLTRYTVSHRYDANGNEIEVIDENGHSTKLTFDKDNRLVLVQDANGIKTVYTYDANNNRTSVQVGVEATVDAAGRVVVTSRVNAQVQTFVYDEFNQLVSRTDGVGNALADSNEALYQQMRVQLGYASDATLLSASDRQALRALHTMHMAYDRVGNLTSQTDNLGRTTRTVYDALDRVERVIDALGGVTTNRYDGNGNLVSATDANNHTTSYTYDSVGRQLAETDAIGTVTTSEYDTFGNLITQTEAAGTVSERVTRYVYNKNDWLMALTDPEGHAQTFEYDAVGNRFLVTDGRGNATRTVFDALNRTVRIIDPLSFETRFEYDGVGNRIALIDARDGTTRFEFDAGNRLIETRDAERRVTQYAYDVRGNRIEVRTAVGTPYQEISSFEYDAENNLRRVVDATGAVNTSNYDRVYNRTAAVDANGNTTFSEFDALNRVIRVTNAEGETTTYAYDAVGNRLSVTDGNGNVTRWVYDAVDRITRQILADGVENLFSYDAVGNRTSVTIAANTASAATTALQYDRNDRLIEQTDALGHTVRYTYDANGNRTAVTDARGNTTLYSYDANNRVVRIDEPVGSVVQYRYDGNGNRVQVIDARGFITTSYFNANNELDLEIDAEGSACAWDYDANGNVISKTEFVTAVGGANPADRPTPVRSPQDQTIRFEHDKANRVTARIDGEGYRTEFVYDAAGNRVTTRQFRDLAGTDVAVTRSLYDRVNRETDTLSYEGYLTRTTYDDAGNVISRTVFNERAELVSGRPQPVSGDAGRLTSYSYDAVYRLVSETSALGVVTRYEYDARGNKVAVVDAYGTSDQRRSEFVYDAANRRTDIIDGAGVRTHYQLDASGNIVDQFDAYGTVAQRHTSRVYDGNNRVVREQNTIGVITDYLYDASGNLLAKTRAVGLAEQRTETFEYDRNNRVTAQVNGAGERTESAYDALGNRIRLTVAPGRPEQRSTQYEFDLDNRLIAATDSNGVRTAYRYDGAGNKIETVQAVGLPGAERHSFYAYDLDNRLIRITDPMGGVTRYEYDVLGNQTHIINSNGGVQVNTFDALGRMLTSLSAGGTLTVNVYDLRGNVVSTTQSFADGSDARTTSYAYDLLDRQVAITDGEGFTTSIMYDAFSNQIAVTNGQYLLSAGDPGYDASKAARAHAQTNTFTFDAADRMLSMSDGEGNLTTYSYDVLGNRLTVTEAANSAPRTTSYRYDLASRLIETITPEGGITRNEFDHAGNKVLERVLQSFNGGANIWIETRFEYDANARVTATIDAYGVRTEYDYDAMGNRTIVRSAAGTAQERVVRMEYDLNNRKTADIDGENNRTAYAYDAAGNRIRVVDALGRVARYYYDQANRLSAVLDPEGALNRFVYDSAGNNIENHLYATRYTGPISDTTAPTPTASAGDRVVRNAFDRANNAIRTIEADGSTTLKTYDGSGNLLTEQLYSNTPTPRSRSYTYDLNNRLVEFTDVDGTVTQFGYDGANNKISERIVSASDPNAVRETRFYYDLNNRLVQQIFDPAGLHFVEQTQYDLVGNVTAFTDANGHATTYGYDLSNRRTYETNGLGLSTLYGYDAVGNRTSVTDARGTTTTFVFDRNNRVTEERGPVVMVYKLGDVQPTPQQLVVRHIYDAFGNEVQTIDAAGNRTTSYFDANARKVAEISGDNVLTAWTYNTFGEAESQTLYMTRVGDDAHQIATRPATPPGEARTQEMSYDLMGRLTRTVYPAIEVTSVHIDANGQPVAIKSTMRPEERVVYDAFGNAVQTFDKNGNRTLAYYDVKGRMIAQVDGAGYLIEWDYDAQDRVLEQRIYAGRLDLVNVDPNTRPSPPAGEVHTLSRRYDAAGRLIAEYSPFVDVLDSQGGSSFERVLTTYTYDNVGNQTSKTSAAGTNQAATEYYYFDAANRRVAVVNANRVLHTFTYDENANVTRQARYFNAISTSISLSTLSGDTDFTALVPLHGNDQITVRAWDVANRVTSETDLMSNDGGADDITKSFLYDSLGRQTRAVDGAAIKSEFEYDAVGRVIRNISPDGTGSAIEYDAAGNQRFLYTGDVTSQAQSVADSDINVAFGDNLFVEWEMPAGSSARSWVVWDTVSRPNLADYASRSEELATWYSEKGQLYIPSSSFGIGSEVYFRVVTADRAGNLAFSAEQVVRIPPRLQAITVNRTGADSVQVRVTAASTAQNLVLNYGAPGTLSNSVTMVLQSDGSYIANLTGVTNLSELAYGIDWSDAAGNHYSTGEQRFRAPGEHLSVATTLGETTVSTGGETRFNITLSTRVPASLAQRFSTAVASWQNLDQAGAPLLNTSVTGTDNGDGTWTFNLTLGSASQALVAGRYRILLTGVFANASEIEAQDIVLDQFEVTLGGTPLSGTRLALSWPAANVGSANAQGQLVLIDGQVVPTMRDPDSQQLTVLTELTTGTHSYDALYGERASTTHNLAVSSTEITEQVPDPNDPNAPPITRVLGYDVGFTLNLNSAETARVNGGVRLAYRPAGSGLQFANSVVMTGAGDQFTATLPRLAAGNYDVKIYYVDANGNEVIVDWLRIDAKTVNVNTTTTSLMVLGSETDGSVSFSGAGLPTVTPGIYSGGADDSRNYVALARQQTGVGPGSVRADGRTTGYFTENQYNALNQLTATNSETGLWREFGVDANGNQVATYLYGTRGNSVVHDSYALFDARDRKIADYSIATEVHGEAGLKRAVTQYGYDAFDHEVEVRDARGSTILRSYNALGSLVREQDKRGAVTLHSYDRLGHQTRTTDALGHSSSKSYDLTGRLVQEISGAGETTEYGYDVFDRRVEIRRIGDGRTVSSSMSYDHHDRLTQQVDGIDNVINFRYDKRDNRTGVQNARGFWTDYEYDGLNRVISTSYLQNGATVTERRQYDAYGNLVAEIDGAQRTSSTMYGAFGRKLAEIDAAGRQMVFEYDAFGNLTREYRSVSQSFSNTGWNGGLGDNLEPWEYAALYAQWNLSGGGFPDIRREYDAAGQLIRINDVATGISTAYKYDIAGNRMQEDVTGTGGHDRHLTYSYDAAGQMTRWADSVTGMHLNYLWDAAGNQKRVYTDAGYSNAVNHWYEYDGGNRLTAQTNGVGGSIISAYGYDGFGNRRTWNNAGVVVTYQYDDIGRVTSSSWSADGANWASTWGYDRVGNLETYTTRKNGSVETTTTNRYSENNLTLFTNTDGQETTNTFDAGQRLTKVALKTDGNTNTFTYTYHADGRQREVIGQGSKKAAGTTTFTYDANDRQIRVDKGKGDGMDRAEFLTFVYNNDGQIIFRFHDEGTDNNRHNTEYQYANGNPVGERKDQNGTITEKLDTGDYNLVKNIGDEFPTQAVSSVSVIDGDSLQAIAARVYGNPSLWFVLAEANGLDPSQPLKAGTRITVPNTIETGALNADAHVIYDESSIIGSALPNLKTPKKKGCGNILAIIIVVVIAVVIAIYAAPLLSVLGSAIGGVLGGGAVATFAGTVIAGAIVGAAASIVQQGLMVAMGYQESFSWSDVGKAALVGAITAGINTGAASGLKSLGEASSTWAKVAQVAIRVGQNAAVQVVKNGKITSWTSLAATALGSSAQAFGSSGVLGALDEVVNGDTIGKYVTPWLNVAESYARTGEVTTSDWANAVGGTLSASLGNGRTSADLAGEDDGSTSLRQNLADMARFTGTQALVAGAMAFVDRDAAAQYFASTLGQEVGDRLGAGFSTGFAAGQRRAEEAEANRRKSQAETSRLAEQASAVPDEPVLDAPTPSNGEQFLPLTDEELEAQAAAENQDQLDAVQETLTEPPVIESTKLKPGQTLWALAKKDLGPGASDAEILARAQQYMELNGVSDPRRLQAGQELLIPSGSEMVSAETKRAYGQSDRELRAYYAEREAAAAAAAAAAQEGAYIRETVSLMEAAANDPNSFYGTYAIAKLSGMTMDQVLAARAASANMPSLDVPSGGAVAAAPQEQGMSTYDKVSFGIHTTLAVGGAIPVLGVIPDAVDFLYTLGEWPFGKSTGTDVTLAGAGILTTVVPGGDQAVAGVKIATRAGRQIVSHMDEVHDAKVILNQAEAVSDAKKATPLLPGELKVDEFGSLGGKKGDDLTGHHVPSKNHMEKKYGVHEDDGIAINMEHPYPGSGGRHRDTFTNGTRADENMSGRDALAAGVRDLRRIYQRDGLYGPQVREALQKLIQMNKDKYPQHFTVKPPK